MNNANGKARETCKPGKPDTGIKTRVSRRIAVLSVVAVVIVAAMAGVFIYRDWVAPFNTVVVEVNDVQIKMRYFLKRVAMSGEPAMNTLQILTREQMIKQAAGAPPFNIEVTAEDVDRFARVLAGGEDSIIEEGEFKEWYRQQLNETRLSDVEFRDLLRTGLLSEKMGEYLSQRVPTVAEQVFINMIPVADISEAETVKEKYEAGGDFATLAREYSVQPDIAEAGGKIGWFPLGVLDPSLDGLAFGLEIGRISDPIPLNEQTFVVIMISEKTAARKIDEQSLAVLKSKVLEKWYREAYKDFKVQFHGFNNGYDSETDAWVQWQLMRLQRGQDGSEGSR